VAKETGFPYGNLHARSAGHWRAIIPQAIATDDSPANDGLINPGHVAGLQAASDTAMKEATLLRDQWRRNFCCGCPLDQPRGDVGVAGVVRVLPIPSDVLVATTPVSRDGISNLQSCEASV
jgi:hypothetical protein